MSERIDKAVELFESGFSCAPAVFGAFSDTHGLDMPTACKVACGFRGGMGHMGDTCGAVTGAYMVIGLRHGQAVADNQPAKHHTTDLIKEFRRRFEARNQFVDCRDLLGFDLGTPEGDAQSKQPGSHDICTKFVRDAAEILVEMGL